MSKEYKKYSDVPKKYRFDLEFLLQGKTKEELRESIVKQFKKLIKIKDEKYTSSAMFLKSIKLSESIELKLNKLTNYINNSMAVNVVDSDMKAFDEETEFIFYNLNKELGPEEPRFQKHSKQIAKWVKLPEYKNYVKSINAQFDDLKHNLPKTIQEFRQKESRADISSADIFSIITNSEMDFGFAKTKSGKKIKVTDANRSILAKHKDPMVRKTSQIAYRNGYLKHKQSLSNILYQHLKKTTVWSNLEKFNSTIEYLLYSDRVPEKMLLSLYDAVQKGIPSFKKFDTYWNKFYFSKFGIKPTKYDRSVELVNVKSKYTPEEAMDLVRESIKPFGSEYLKQTDIAFSENWVDFMPVKNKETGAYSIGGTFGIEKKLINMNFDGTLNSVSTLAHELGHSMHSYFSDKNQPQNLSQYSIFIAEIASIFNELMLSDYLLKNSDNDKLKFNIRTSMVNGFRATVVRQAMWSNYEYEMYKAIESGKPISSFESISKIYNEVDSKYTNSKRKNKEEDAWMGIMVPHFYYNFYVYKYVIGQLCANIFFQKYKEEGPEALQFYINEFLSAGDRDWPIQVLKDAGIDLMDPETYKIGFRSLDENINEWVKLGKKIFKTK